ncbi:MAG: thiamine-monophosphate kinase [Myxococcota bacterium]|jgi:thiamine-monophosphate kinase
MPTLRQIGEFNLIARIAKRAAKLKTPEIVLGIGDDAAILRPRRGEDLVVSTDALVENVHFRFRNQAPATIGRRALLVNLSDLAAMGARPVGFTLALSAPPSISMAKIDGFLSGLIREASAHGCPLIGGNLSQGTEVTLAVTVIGAVAKKRALLRGSAKPGDRVFVTGTLGGAALALAAAEKPKGRLRHLPTAQLEAGRALARMKHRVACIDVSDGLASDLSHLVSASGCGAEIDPLRLPTPRGFDAACARLGLDPLALATRGGEDYELLFTLPGRGPGGRALNLREAGLSKRLGVAVTEIGCITRSREVAGLTPTRDAPGYRHF